MSKSNTKRSLKIGDKAPHFSLISHLGDRINLADYLGKKNVVIAFFPLSWTPI